MRGREEKERGEKGEEEGRERGEKGEEERRGEREQEPIHGEITQLEEIRNILKAIHTV